MRLIITLSFALSGARAQAKNIIHTNTEGDNE